MSKFYLENRTQISASIVHEYWGILEIENDLKKRGDKSGGGGEWET